MISRRRLIAGGALGAGGLLPGGCDRLNGNRQVRKALAEAEALHLSAQRLAGGHEALAREFAESQMSSQFRANGNVAVADAAYRRHAATGFAQWALAVDGLVARPLSLPLSALLTLKDR